MNLRSHSIPKDEEVVLSKSSKRKRNEIEPDAENNDVDDIKS